MFNPLNIAGSLIGSLTGQDGAPPLDISDRLQSQIGKSFVYHAPRQGQPEKYEAIRDAAGQLAKLMAHLAPGETRELSLALTNLEQAVMWANAAIARHE